MSILDSLNLFLNFYISRESYSSIVSSITCMENLDVENEESLSNLIKALVNHEAYRNSMIKVK